jgi:hypothetical protein
MTGRKSARGLLARPAHRHQSRQKQLNEKKADLRAFFFSAYPITLTAILKG